MPPPLALALANVRAGLSPSAGGTGISNAAFIAGGIALPGFLDSALNLIGDVFDPFLPGGAGSDVRATSSSVTLAQINQQRKAAGLPTFRVRRRRKVALTASDLQIMAMISTTISKEAAKMFIAQRTRRG